MGNEGGERWRWARGKAYCLERKCTFTIVNRPSCNDKGKKRKKERKKRSSRFHRNISLSLSISDVNISRETFFKNSSPLHLSSKTCLFFSNAESSSLWSSRQYRKSISSRQYWRSARFAFSPCSYEVDQNYPRQVILMKSYLLKREWPLEFPYFEARLIRL